MLPECASATPASVILLLGVTIYLHEDGYFILLKYVLLTLAVNIIITRIIILNLDFLFNSDLALRNCLLTSDVTVKIGDYGLSHSKYKARVSLIRFLNYCEILL